MIKKQAEDIYAGKTFYIKNPDGSLDGPREDIYYAVYYATLFQKLKAFVKGERRYKFLQIIDGTPKRAFYKDEIVVVQNG